MSGTKVKICGITTASDARVTDAAGADYLGLIFAESPRRITRSRAQKIRGAVPDATLVGVFKDQPLQGVIKTITDCDINLVQLHGGETPEYCRSLIAATGKPLIKTVRSGRNSDLKILGEYHNTSFFLFDLEKNAGQQSGGDVATLWSDASRTRRRGFRVFLAGALTVDNVREAIRRTDVFCVDVCRGVESKPGRKDAEALRRFIAEVRT